MRGFYRRLFKLAMMFASLLLVFGSFAMTISVLAAEIEPSVMGVYIDGNRLNPGEHYDANTFAIHKSYLDALSDGTHTINFYLSDGTSTGETMFILNKSKTGAGRVQYVIDEMSAPNSQTPIPSPTPTESVNETQGNAAVATETTPPQNENNDEFLGVPYSDDGLESSSTEPNELNAVADKTPSFGVVPQTGVPSLMWPIVGVCVSSLSAVALLACAFGLAAKRK